MEQVQVKNDLAAALGNKINVRGDAIATLGLSEADLSEKYDKVKNGWYWRNFLERPANIGGLVAIIAMVNGRLDVATGVGALILSFALESIGGSMDKRKQVRSKVKGEISGKLCDLNYEKAESRSETVCDLAKATNKSQAYIAAADIDDDRMTAMFNKASKAKAWADRSLYGAIGFLVAAVGSTFVTDNQIVPTISAAALAASFASVVWNSRAVSSVKREVDDAAYDRLVELHGKNGPQTPQNL